MLPVMKHMPGHGRAVVDSHHKLPVVEASFEELAVSDFVPFTAMKDEVMGHVRAHRLHRHRSGPAGHHLAVVVEQVIRGHMGFDGC